MKKFISLLLTAVMVLTTASVFAGDASQKDYPQKFWDVPKDHWAFEYIAELVNKGVLAGYEDGSFRPDDTVTRAEWAKIMVLAAGLPVSDNNLYFKDMKDHWANRYVNTAKDYLAAYTDGTFKPDQAAVREDVTVSLVKLKGYDINSVDYSYLSQFTDANSISNSLKAYVAVAVEKQLISGFEDNTFRGQDTLTRAEAATLLWKAFQYGSDNKVVNAPDTPVTTPPAATTPIQTAQPTEKSDTTQNMSNEQTETQEPNATPTPEPEVEIKPYKVDTVVKADVKDLYEYTFDGSDTIYYVENNAVYSVNVNSKSKDTVLSLDDLIVDTDEMALDDFKLNSIFCDVNTGKLYISGSYGNVNSISKVNNNYLYSINGSSVEFINDNFSVNHAFAVLSNGDYISGHQINGVTSSVVETGNKLYYWAYCGPSDGYLYESDYVNGEDKWIAPIPVYAAGFTDNSVVCASKNSIYTYNFKGKELSKITPDDYEVQDKTKIDFSSSPSYKLYITSNENIIFYDTAAKAFRMISENR